MLSPSWHNCNWLDSIWAERRNADVGCVACWASVGLYGSQNGANVKGVRSRYRWLKHFLTSVQLLLRWFLAGKAQLNMCSCPKPEFTCFLWMGLWHPVYYRVFHNSCCKITAYCSYNMCLGDILSRLGAHQMWYIFKISFFSFWMTS